MIFESIERLNLISHVRKRRIQLNEQIWILDLHLGKESRQDIETIGCKRKLQNHKLQYGKITLKHIHNGVQQPCRARHLDSLNKGRLKCTQQGAKRQKSHKNVTYQRFLFRVKLNQAVDRLLLLGANLRLCVRQNQICERFQENVILVGRLQLCEPCQSGDSHLNCWMRNQWQKYSLQGNLLVGFRKLGIR